MFNSQAEMDRNAKRWLAFFVPAILGLGVILTGIIAWAIGVEILDALVHAAGR